MIDILASGIILYGNSNGVWSPSHPHMYPQPITHQQVEDRYVPYTPLTDENGDRIIF